jgi:hypothetical protein
MLRTLNRRSLAWAFDPLLLLLFSRLDEEVAVGVPLTFNTIMLTISVAQRNALIPRRTSKTSNTKLKTRVTDISRKELTKLCETGL